MRAWLFQREAAENGYAAVFGLNLLADWTTKGIPRVRWHNDHNIKRHPLPLRKAVPAPSKSQSPMPRGSRHSKSIPSRGRGGWVVGLAEPGSRCPHAGKQQVAKKFVLDVDPENPVNEGRVGGYAAEMGVGVETGRGCGQCGKDYARGGAGAATLECEPLHMSAVGGQTVVHGTHNRRPCVVQGHANWQTG